MRTMSAPAAVLLALAVMLMKPNAHAAVAVTGLGMTGMQIHLRTDTRNLPSGDVIDPL